MENHLASARAKSKDTSNLMHKDVIVLAGLHIDSVLVLSLLF